MVCGGNGQLRAANKLFVTIMKEFVYSCHRYQDSWMWEVWSPC